MTDLILPRRTFLAGLAAALAAPAIVRVDALMKLPRPVRARGWQHVELELDVPRFDEFWHLPRRQLTISVPDILGDIKVGDLMTISNWGTGRITSVLNVIPTIRQ